MPESIEHKKAKVFLYDWLKARGFNPKDEHTIENQRFDMAYYKDNKLIGVMECVNTKNDLERLASVKQDLSKTIVLITNTDFDLDCDIIIFNPNTNKLFRFTKTQFAGFLENIQR